MKAAAKLSSALLIAAVLMLACRGDSAPTKIAAAPAENVVAQGGEVVEGGAPRITADEATYAFGAIGATDTVEHVFKIRNAGDADLKIDRVQKTWGCTATVISDDVVPPGGEGEIKVTLRPKGGHTEITKNVVVYSNDPEQPRFTLTMKGTLLVDMEAVPPTVQMVNLAPGKPGTATVSVERSQGSTASVKSVRIEDTKRFSIREVEPQLGALASYEIRFAGGDVGTAATKVVIETTGEHTPRLTIPVRASAVYNLSYPKRVTLTRRGSGPFEQTLRVSTRRGDPPKIERVEDPDGLLEIEVLEPDGPRVDIRLRVREKEAATVDERGAHELLVFTNDPDEPKVAIEYNLRTVSAPSRPRAGKR